MKYLLFVFLTWAGLVFASGHHPEVNTQDPWEGVWKIIFDNGIIGLVLAGQAFWIYRTDKSHREETKTQLENYIFIAFALIAVATGMKLGGNIFGNMLFKQPRNKSLRTAFALSAPRGEFSIVIVKVGVDMGMVSAFLFPLIGLISIITAFMSPFIIRAGDKVILKLSKS